MQSVRLPSGTGEVDVVEEGGRIAGLYPDIEGPNLLWRGDTVAPLTGGDRLWLAPERDVLYEGDPSVRDNWRCPAELDPGSWAGRAEGGQVSLRQEALGAEMRRTIRPLREPLADTDLPWTGCEVDEEVLTDRDWSGWHLAMVPVPARLFVRDARDPVVIFRPAPQPEAGWVRATGTGEWKLGFDAPDDGRVVVAAVGDADPGRLVVLATYADPAGTYVDVPPPGGGPATAIQLYDSPHLGFCEIEHHFPLETRAATTVLFGAFGSVADRLELLERIVRDAAAT